MGHAGDIVEQVTKLGHERIEEALELMHEDAEYLAASGVRLQGRGEIAAYVRSELERLGDAVPEQLVMGLVERGDDVVIFGQVRYFHSAPGRPDSVEIRPTAWHYVIKGDRIASVTLHDTW